MAAVSLPRLAHHCCTLSAEIKYHVRVMVFVALHNAPMIVMTHLSPDTGHLSTYPAPLGLMTMVDDILYCTSRSRVRDDA